jgi:4-hydroxyphenylacetate 3-monooxygenase
MIRTGEQYKDSTRDRRVVYVNRERLKDVTTHPQFKPLVDVRARIYDIQHEAKTRDIMTIEQDVLKFLESQKRSQKCQQKK